VTLEQIAGASGVSVSTLTRLFKVTRLSTTAAEAILAVRPPEQLVAAPDSARQLQALVADGWTVEQLAAAAGLNDRTLWQAVHGYTTPSRRTAAAVGQL
jgi:transcriptional regulator with XRE-family HTH domain